VIACAPLSSSVGDLPALCSLRLGGLSIELMRSLIVRLARANYFAYRFTKSTFEQKDEAFLMSPAKLPEIKHLYQHWMMDALRWNFFKPRVARSASLSCATG
jgi:hypothetical protein